MFLLFVPNIFELFNGAFGARDDWSVSWHKISSAKFEQCNDLACFGDAHTPDAH